MVLRCVAIFIAIVLPIAQFAAADDNLPPVCGGKQRCPNMRTCSEAVHYHTQCGLSDLDRNNNGIPCEDVCGKSIETMHERMASQPYSPSKLSQLEPAEPVTTGLTCGSKRTYGAMTSCQEATFFLASCGVKSLDRDRDGVPCEGLCR